MVYKNVNISKYPKSLNSRTFFNDRSMNNTTQPNTLLNMLQRGYHIGELLLVQINPNNSRMHHKAKTNVKSKLFVLIDSLTHI